MTSTELTEIEAWRTRWKDNEIIKDIGTQLATTRQIYDNMMLEGLHTARASTRTGNLLQGNPNDIGFRRDQFWSRTSR